MKRPSPSIDERYAAFATAIAKDSAAALGSPGKKGFGASALQINGKIFAMLSHQRLVVKLARARVDDLIASGAGERFDPGHGRLMKEWLAIAPSQENQWLPLAKEAMSFVGGPRRA